MTQQEEAITKVKHLLQLHLKYSGFGNGYIEEALEVLDSVKEPCNHRIADIRNEKIKSGYMCLACGAIFVAADHDAVKEPEPAGIDLEKLSEICSDIWNRCVSADEGAEAIADLLHTATPISEVK